MDDFFFYFLLFSRSIQSRNLKIGFLSAGVGALFFPFRGFARSIIHKRRGEGEEKRVTLLRALPKQKNKICQRVKKLWAGE